MTTLAIAFEDAGLVNYESPEYVLEAEKEEKAKVAKLPGIKQALTADTNEIKAANFGPQYEDAATEQRKEMEEAASDVRSNLASEGLRVEDSTNEASPLDAQYKQEEKGEVQVEKEERAANHNVEIDQDIITAACKQLEAHCLKVFESFGLENNLGIKTKERKVRESIKYVTIDEAIYQKYTQALSTMWELKSAVNPNSAFYDLRSQATNAQRQIIRAHSMINAALGLMDRKDSYQGSTDPDEWLANSVAEFKLQAAFLRAVKEVWLTLGANTLKDQTMNGLFGDWGQLYKSAEEYRLRRLKERQNDRQVTAKAATSAGARHELEAEGIVL